MPLLTVEPLYIKQMMDAPALIESSKHDDPATLDLQGWHMYRYVNILVGRKAVSEYTDYKAVQKAFNLPD